MSEVCDGNSSNFPKHEISASICDIREIISGKKSKPVFIITVQSQFKGENASYEITKEYKDFFELQCSILDTFPVESGKNGYERIVPYLPGRKIFQRDDLHLAQERKPGLNKYMLELLKLRKSISQSKLVLDFFAEEEIDKNMDREELVNQSGKESPLSKTTESAPSNSSQVEWKELDVTDLQSYVNTSYHSDEVCDFC
ncbi:SH3 and PX domain-containing protein 2A-like [Dendronephthya gigantea]|uniref:SH3 and PX domain-containing protein 2A-like n=1 Tax=Dendronephthya gigantea TaxID=151771 RepID=UPI00106DAC9B|nr:SH3 and PX domain-containing protein 2A-like [Dendronephthya gigantea]